MGLYKRKNPYTDPLSIGNLAIQRGYATKEQVLAAVKEQETRLPLGEILIEHGVLTILQLEELLMEQDIRRQGMNEYEIFKYIKKKRHERMKDVISGLRVLTTSIHTFKG